MAQSPTNLTNLTKPTVVIFKLRFKRDVRILANLTTLLYVYEFFYKKVTRNLEISRKANINSGYILLIKIGLSLNITQLQAKKYLCYNLLQYVHSFASGRCLKIETNAFVEANSIKFRYTNGLNEFCFKETQR